ncbi:MAG: hypothetical protein Q9164_006982, partial [Protoblastenia rupestris]
MAAIFYGAHSLLDKRINKMYKSSMLGNLTQSTNNLTELKDAIRPKFSDPLGLSKTGLKDD